MAGISEKQPWWGYFEGLWGPQKNSQKYNGGGTLKMRWWTTSPEKSKT